MTHGTKSTSPLTVTRQTNHGTEEDFEKCADHLDHFAQTYSLGYEKGPKHGNLHLRGAYRVGTTNAYATENTLNRALRDCMRRKFGWGGLQNHCQALRRPSKLDA